LDVPRTLQSHIMFKTRYGPGQRSMFNVLKAFSNYDQQVGFCQGMANIVAILLLYYSEESLRAWFPFLDGRFLYPKEINGIICTKINKPFCM
ncbi:22216_t:CDS:2, partial [Entrophospora sp. SA101]